MDDSKTLPTTYLAPHKVGRTPHPRIFRRSFGCGHLDEFIELRVLDDGEEVHNVISVHQFLQHNQVPNSLPNYYNARCLRCAKRAKEKDDADLKVRIKRTIGAYQAATESIRVDEQGEEKIGGFDGVLERYKNGEKGKGSELHARVLEEEHLDYRRECQERAMIFPGKWISVPVRRVWNWPIQTTGEAKSKSPMRRLPHQLDDKDSKTLQSAYNAARRDIQCSKIHASERSLRARTEDVVAGYQQDLELQEASDREDLLVMRAEINHSRGGSATPERRSAFVEHLFDRYASPFDESLGPPFVNQRKYELSHPPPVEPRREFLASLQRRSSAASKASAISESWSKNFRRLRVDAQRSTSVKKTEPDSDSLDWACQTSLAVQAGRISMESVSKLSHSMAERVIMQDKVPEGRRNTYSSTSSPYGAVTSTTARYSDGTQREIAVRLRSEAIVGAARGSGSDHPARLLASVEIASRGKMHRRDSAQTKGSADLNKDLPALPAQDAAKKEREVKAV